MADLNLYSSRNREMPEAFQTEDFPRELRIQISEILFDGFPPMQIPDPNGYSQKEINVQDDLLRKMVKDLRREYGILRLVPRGMIATDVMGEMIDFLLSEARVERILDMIEHSFSMFNILYERCYSYRSSVNVPGLAAELNKRFKQHGIGFQFTGCIVVKMSDPFIHDNMLIPVLRTLSPPKFDGPRQELLEALKNYRNGLLAQSLVECGKALESTMKVICNGRGWEYKKNKATAKALIQVLFEKELLPSQLQNHFSAIRQQLESCIPPLRNQRGVSHGQGDVVVEIPDHIAKYALHMTIVTIQMLIEADEAKAS